MPGDTIRTYAALIRAGFRRYATYRQATVAAIFTNSVFGFLVCYAMLAAARGAGGAAGGYSGDRLATYVWMGQGLIGTVMLMAPLDLVERIRTGEVIAELLRPVNLVWRELADTIGGAGYGVITRLAVPVAVGAVTFDLYAPRRLATYPLFVVSVLLAVVACFGCRYLVSATAFWLLDARGAQLVWQLASVMLTGLAFPLWFLPGWAARALVYATPLPSAAQLPLDVLVERGSLAGQLVAVAVQSGWVVLVLAACQLVQRRAERRLVIQGG